MSARVAPANFPGMPLVFPQMNARDEVPLYLQVANVIEQAIRDGSLAPGQVLPSESDLIGMTGCGRKTVRHAVAVLRDKGIVYSVAKRGTYVARGRPPGDASR